MKTPDEIKKGLECCVGLDANQPICSNCPYYTKDDMPHCSDLLRSDVFTLIRQLEAQVPKWISDDGSILCPYCGIKIRMIPAWQKSMPDMGGYIWAARGKCTVCGSITPEMHGRTAKEANAAAYAAAQWGHIPLLKPPKES